MAYSNHQAPVTERQKAAALLYAETAVRLKAATPSARSDPHYVDRMICYFRNGIEDVHEHIKWLKGREAQVVSTEPAKVSEEEPAGKPKRKRRRSAAKSTRKPLTSRQHIVLPEEVSAQ